MMDLAGLFVPSRGKLALSLSITLAYAVFLALLQPIQFQCHPIHLFAGGSSITGFVVSYGVPTVPPYCSTVDAIVNANHLFYYSEVTYPSATSLYIPLQDPFMFYMHFFALFVSMYSYFLVSYAVSCGVFGLVRAGRGTTPAQDPAANRRKLLSFAKWLVIIPIATLVILFVFVAIWGNIQHQLHLLAS
jgi:hypothetical protein